MRIVRLVTPLPETEAGLNAQIVSAGKPEHDAGEKFTVPLKPFIPVMVRAAVTNVPEWGMVIAGWADNRKSDPALMTLTATAAESLGRNVPSPS